MIWIGNLYYKEQNWRNSAEKINAKLVTFDYPTEENKNLPTTFNISYPASNGGLQFTTFEACGVKRT
jgi:hypothetical protein